MGKLIHGMTRTKCFQAWTSMRDRCSRPKCKRYSDYGGRGIKITERWKDFINFYCDMGEPLPGLMLERIDNNGHYEPSNCRWATHKEQARNRRNKIRWITFDGRTQCLTDWATEFGIKITTLYRRIVISKYPLEKAFTLEKYQRP